MESAQVKTRGILSLPAKPIEARRTLLLQPSHALKQRIFTRHLPPLSISSNLHSKFQSFHKILISNKERNISFICKAEAAAGEGDSTALTPPKVFGVEITTLKKIVPLGLMFFCILFNYTILRDTKDVLVVTVKGSSAEIIPFLKTWVNLPMAIDFMLLYTKLSNVLSKKALFYTVIVPFIAYFGAFGFIMYPLNNLIHPEVLADKLLATLGPRFMGPLAIMRIWSFCLFYVMAELWGSVVVSVLFWSFANQITTVDEAKKFYPLFGLEKNLGPGVDGWAVSLKAMISIVVGMGLAICFLYWWVNRYVPRPIRSKKKKAKPQMGTMESLKFLVSSPYIRDLATLVVAYGISINLVEVTWKSKGREGRRRIFILSQEMNYLRLGKTF
ncbi:hypothetical protein BRARA_J00557 [Brassica rapa]|uniref:ADP,ATP carrier protein n=1 Tax=Brassica campestris TaxID=3711 RepID=A0A397XIG2_BRACM|nr:hypothetical protein BRARA_J00557 [Brassica rapa]